MSTTWDLSVGRRTLLWGKSYVPDQLLLLFNDENLILDQPRASSLNDTDDDGYIDDVAVLEGSNEPIFSYRSTVDAIRSRLDLQGFGSRRVTEHAIRYLDEEREDEEQYVPESWTQYAEKFTRSNDLLNAILRWQLGHLQRPQHHDFNSEECYLEHMWNDLIEAFDDPRFELALKLRRSKSTTSLTLDMTDLLLGGDIEVDEQPHRTARKRHSHEVVASGRVIVITEGRTDARWLHRAISLAAPELAEAFSFLDFEGTSAPGGVDRVVSLTRGMAAAGVMNRVIAVLDNDAAGRAAAIQLRQNGLPEHMTVVCLPDVEYARSYPTLGPQGNFPADINGRAVTAELMFGTSLLASSNNTGLTPVRWGGYNGSVQSYQGSIEEKSKLGAKIDRALSVGELDELEPGVADGCQRLVAMLVDGTAKASPTMASQRSPLLWGFSRES